MIEAGQEALAEKAASIGVERFVMDDGWFGQRKDDHAGLGDWYVNKEKFPNGLKPLIDKVHSLGMDFGLWVEPEMVNPDSDLYRKHPGLGAEFCRASSQGTAQSTGAESGAPRCAGITSSVFSTTCLKPESDCVSEVGLQSQLVGAGLARGSSRGTEEGVRGVRTESVQHSA